MNHENGLDAHRIARPIVMACDESYAMQLATALRSAVEANRSGRPLDVYLLSEHFSASLRQRVSDSLPEGSTVIHWVPVDLSSFAEFSLLPYLARVTYARLAIPGVFPEGVSRVLYLDADLLVLDDLAPLWDTDLQGAVIGAVLDQILDPRLKAGAPGLKRCPRVRDYFNAGVLLIDLDRWRKEAISENAMQYLNRHPDSPIGDQDALNVACDGRWIPLDRRWNCFDQFAAPILGQPSRDRPGILHFAGEQKPWRTSTLSVNADLYEAFRRRTRFPRTNETCV